MRKRSEPDSARPSGRLVVTDVRLRSGNLDDGVVAWASVVLCDGLILNNLAVRRDDDGRLQVRFPGRRAWGGEVFFAYHPLSQEVRDMFVGAILAKLREMSAADDDSPAEALSRDDAPPLRPNR